jgi:hypothetical protein
MAPPLENVAAALRSVEEPRTRVRRAEAAPDEQRDLLPVDRVPKRVEGFRRVPLVADGANGPCPARRFDDGRRVVERPRDRLLEVDVEPALERRDRRRPVLERRRADPHRVELLPLQQIAPVAVGARSRRREALRPLRIQVADGDDLHLAEPAEDRDVVVRDPPCADDRCAKRRHARTLLQRRRESGRIAPCRTTSS